MAKQTFKKCLGVDIGTTSVKICEVAADKNGAKVLNLVYAPLPAFPDAEAAELGTAKIIRDVLKERNIKTRETVFCLPGQQIFTRRVRLPDTSEERLTRIINYEARQQIPFPEEKTRIEYQIFRHPEEEDVEVLMVAARKDQIASYMRLVGRTGLRPIGLSVSSLALFNYHAFDLMPFEKEEKKKKEKAKKKKKGEELEGEEKTAKGDEATVEQEVEFLEEESFTPEEVPAFLNIGETYTDLVIGRKAKAMTLAFVRSINMGGREMTKAIQNAVGLNDPLEAARLKKERVALEAEGEEGERPDVDEGASEAVAEFLETRLAKQIQLSLDFFIAQPDGMAVDSMTISGGQAVLPGLSGMLEDRLAMPVDRLKEPQNPAMLINVNPDSTYSDFPVAIGAALSGIEFSPVQLNFLPEAVKTRLVFPRTEVTVLAILIGIMVFLSSIVGGRYVQVYEEAAVNLQQQANQFQPLQQRISQAEEERENVKESIETLLKAIDVVDRDYLLEIYAELVNTVRDAAPLAQLTYLEVKPYGDLTMRGRSSNSQDAPNIKRALDEVDLYLEDVTLEGNYPVGQNEYEFEIKGKVKQKSSRISTPIPTATPIGGVPAGGQPFF